jgi:hypothetical protein
VTLEEQFAVGLAGLSVALLLIGVGAGRYLRDAPPKIVRVVFPIMAMFTLACFAIYVFVARAHVKG